MSDSANYPENGNGAADPIASKAGRVDVLPYLGNARAGGRLTRGLRLWARKNFSRKQLLTSLKTLLWVAPLTILIWIYAEREQQFTPPPVTIPIEITTNDPNRVVTLRRPGPDEPWIMAKITGPRSGVEAVMHSWDPAYGGGPVRIEIARTLDAGDNRIDASLIGNDPRFASHGVSVSSCQPAWLDVVIDPIDERLVDVKPVDLPSNVSVTFTPPRVKVRGPKRVLDEAAAAGTLHADASLAHQPALAAATPSDHTVDLKDVPLSVNDRRITIVGAPVVQAKANLTEKVLTLPTVTVEIATIAKVADDYRITFPPTLTDVTVVGPEDKLELLSPSNPDSAKYRRATFDVTMDDIDSLQPGKKTVQVEWKFPPGVEYKSGPKTIEFSWERRSSRPPE